ncbi:MAG: MBL fold metallo-hydrolase [Solirubrobacteraceae bacterium]
MRVEWYGQSAFALQGQDVSVFIDPFGDIAAAMGDRGVQFEYPTIEGVSADLLLITHEHLDHNAAEAIGGEPAVIRSTAGKLDSPAGEVIAIASEHDDAAGTQRGPNTIFKLTLDGLRVCHFGDFGQGALRDSQREAIGEVDLLIVPVGGGPTIGAQGAHELVAQLRPRWVLPMHYRTRRIGFLEGPEEFLGGVERLVALDGPAFDTGDLPSDGAAAVTVVPSAP